MFRLLTSRMITVRVGSERTKWTLHADLLRSRSEYFAERLQNDSNDNDQAHKDASDDDQAHDAESENESQDESQENNSKNDSDEDEEDTPSHKTIDLPEEDETAFSLFVPWLYSSRIQPADTESDIGPLLELSLLSSTLKCSNLQSQVLEEIRSFYDRTDTFPGLRRVQYVYEYTCQESPLRALIIGSVARYLVLRQEGIPEHWTKALQRDGRLAVDLLLEIQRWRLDAAEIPDVRRDPEAVRGLITEREDADGNEHARRDDEHATAQSKSEEDEHNYGSEDQNHEEHDDDEETHVKLEPQDTNEENNAHDSGMDDDQHS